MREDKIINKPLDIPFKEFMPGQVIQSVQFNDDMKDIEDKVNEIVDKHNLGINKLHDHLEDLNNPHNVTPHQIGTYTNEEIDEFVDDIKNGNLFDKSISNRVLDDECVDTRVIQDGSVTVSKVDPELGSQLNLENNISITSRYTKEETDAIIRERVGDGTYSREEIDSKFEEYQAGTIVDGTIGVDKLKYDVGTKLDISANPSIIDRYTKTEVNNLIQKNGLPKDWGGLGEIQIDTPITNYGHLPIADVMTADEFIAPLTTVLDIDVKENVDARGEYSSLGDRLNKSDEKQEELSSQLEHKPNKEELSYFNVKFLGAKGDGVTNDTEALKKAFENYNNIYIPEGTFIFNDTLTLIASKKKNIIQHGTLKFTGHGTAINIRTLFNTPTDWQGLRLEGIEEGIGLLVTANGGWGRNVYLRNFFIKDFKENVRIESGYNITFEHGIVQTRHIPLFIGANDGSKDGNTSFSNVLTFNNVYFGGYSDNDKCESCMVSTCCFHVNMNNCTFEYGEFGVSGFSSSYPFNDGATGNPKINYNSCWFEGLTTLYANYCDKYINYNNYHVCSYNSLNFYNGFYERITNKYSFKDIYNNSILTNTMFPENQNIREISTNATSLKSLYNQNTLYNYNRTQGVINGKRQLIESYSNKGRRYILPNNIVSAYTGDSTQGVSINITSLNSLGSNEKTGLKHILKVYVYATDFNGKYAFKEYKFFEKKENEYVLYGESDVIYDGNKDPIFHIEFTNINDVVRLNATLTETSIYPKLELNVETIPISSYTI